MKIRETKIPRPAKKSGEQVRQLLFLHDRKAATRR